MGVGVGVIIIIACCKLVIFLLDPKFFIYIRILDCCLVVVANTTYVVPATSDLINQTTTSSINISSGNVSIRENTDPLAITYTETNHQPSYTPVLTDLTNSVSFSSPRVQPTHTTSTSLLPGTFFSPVMRNVNDCSSSLSLSSTHPAQNALTANSALSNSSSKPMDALVDVIERYMTSTCAQISNKKQKRSIERQYGESLTSMDVFMRLKQKENAKNKKATRRPRSMLNQSNSTKRPRKSKNPQQFLMDIDALDDNNSTQYSNGLFPSSSYNYTDAINPKMAYVPSTSSTTNFIANPPTVQYVMPTQSDYPTCYRCYSILYTDIIHCVKCNRSCCYPCAQPSFSSTTVICECCMIQDAL
ncbi:unnamed protein product [Rotaria magnacalcarata]|uniref:Uncharacterized protein n=1 Tax=Rotaria magnacalcarata TaxID=392030 RepID=A0A816XN90_9BILA|nr:unnamed protein product [Rotaria magnacalcarata]